MTDRLIRITTAFAVVAVVCVAAIISYQHAYELVRSHGESRMTARLLPFTVDGLIWAASMVVLDASRRNRVAPRLATGSLGVGIVATVSANLAHGLGHGPIGALVSAWPALALVGSFELLMILIKTLDTASTEPFHGRTSSHLEPTLEQGAPSAASSVHSLEETIRAWYSAGHSQRGIARELNIDRRKVRRIVDGPLWSSRHLGSHIAGFRSGLWSAPYELGMPPTEAYKL